MIFQEILYQTISRIAAIKLLVYFKLLSFLTSHYMK